MTIQMIRPGTSIKAQDIEPGMVVKTSQETIGVERVLVKWGAVQVAANGRWTGLGLDESVEVAGYFNLED